MDKKIRIRDATLNLRMYMIMIVRRDEQSCERKKGSPEDLESTKSIDILLTY